METITSHIFMCVFMLLTIMQPMIWDNAKVNGEVPGPSGDVQEVKVLAGSRVLLSCNITPEAREDSPILVLFYNGITGMPIYSIDARGGELVKWVHLSELGKRAHFNTAVDHQGLVIDSVKVDDAGSYRCRVDFRSSPTRNMRVKLTVVVPPKRITITDQSGQSMSGVIGPYPVSSTLILSCQVTGGVPRPSVIWWRENVILDDVAEVQTEDAIHNELSLPNLSRQHLFMGLTCRAQNSNLTLPLSATVSLDIIFPPLEVKISGSENPLSAGEPTWVMCESSGSRPLAKLSWWLDEAQIPNSDRQQVAQDGNVSRSSLQLHPSQQHDGAMLACRAENSLLEAAAIEDAHKLTVYYSPKLRLKAGQNLDLSNIKEGDDVYFECSIQANPMDVTVNWYLNGEELRQNVTFGIIRSNQSLVLQKVTRTCSGEYTCEASNLHGTGTSNTIKLRVKFAPVCSAGQRWVYGGGREHPVNVTCSVDAHPEAKRFRWAFNTSSEYVDIPESRIRKGKGRSMVAYTPQTHHDFGSLICWGVNEVGIQKVPCVYHIVPASVPEPVHNCSSWQNASASGEILVSCVPGWGGGLSQSFTLEVRTLTSSLNSIKKQNTLKVIKERRKPYFTVTDLQPGTEYQLSIYSSNAQGPSKPTYLMHMTPIDVAEKRTSVVATETTDYERQESSYPLVAILIGLVATLLLCLVVLVVLVRRKRISRSRSPEQESNDVYQKANTSQKMCEEEYSEAAKEKRPDVILVKNERDKIIGEDGKLVIEHVKPCDQRREGKLPMRGSGSVERIQDTHLLQQRELLPSAVSIHALQSPSFYHDTPSCPVQQQQQRQQQGPFCTSTFPRRQHHHQHQQKHQHILGQTAFVVSSGLTTAAPPPPASLGGFPPPPPVPPSLSGLDQVMPCPSSAPSTSIPCSSSLGSQLCKGTRESCV